MKIMFLNTWEATTGEVFWNYIKEEAKSVDIFCFMEAGDKFREKWREILPNYTLFFKDCEVTNEEGCFQSTFVKNDYEIIKTGVILDDDPLVGEGLYTQIQGKNKIFNIMNVHGVSRPGDKRDNPKRLEQSQKIIDYMAKIEGTKLIGGDFNLDKGTESVGKFEKNGYRNLIEEFKIETTRNHLIWNLFPDNKQLWADFLFVTPDVKVKSFEVPKNEVSDHLPLILEIEE